MSDPAKPYRNSGRAPHQPVQTPDELPLTQPSSQLQSSQIQLYQPLQDHSEKCEQEAIHMEARNRDLAIRLNELEKELSNDPDPLVSLDGEEKDCARLEYTVDLLEAELSGAVFDQRVLETTTTTTALEIAFSQMQDTLSQLRQAQSREIAKIEQETEQLEHEKILRNEAEILSKALSARLAADPPSSEELLCKSRERISQLQEHFRKLQAGLVDLVDHVAATYTIQIDPNDKLSSSNVAKPANTLPEHFIRMASFEEDTPDRRAFELKRVLETLMNEVLSDEEGAFKVLPAHVQSTSTEGNDDSAQSALLVLERVGIAEQRGGFWRLRFSL